jgi:hypothetical protein
VDSGSKKVIVAANGSEKIDGAASADLVSQYDSITLISTGTAWMTTAKVVITP